MPAPKTLVIQIAEIHGHCPVYRVGDCFRIRDGYRLEADRPLCMHALASLMPYYVALSRGISSAELGLADGQGIACVQCLDPAHRTGGGTVTFQIHVGEDKHA